MGFQEQQTSAYMDKMVTIKNLRDELFTVKIGGENFVLNPNSEEVVPMWLGRHIMRHGYVDGRAVVELIENVKVTCGVCQKEFDTKRELGAHSLSHKRSAATKE